VISLLLPSRGRPQQLVELWHTVVATADDLDDIEMVVRVDDDDSSYDDLRSRGTRGQIHFIEGQRLNEMTVYWNDTWVKAHGDIFMHCADDIRFREPGWDLRVKLHVDQLPPDRIGMVYGRDGAHDMNLATHGFITREWTNVVGYFLPPYFSCDWADQWIFDVAGLIGRRVYDPLIFNEHMHPALGKGELDQTHRDRLERDVRDNNTQRWIDLQPEKQEWAAKLLAAIGG
jgi:hypothetical protein